MTNFFRNAHFDDSNVLYDIICLEFNGQFYIQKDFDKWLTLMHLFNEIYYEHKIICKNQNDNTSLFPSLFGNVQNRE